MFFFTFVSDFLFAQKVTDAEKKEQYYKEMMSNTWLCLMDHSLYLIL